MKPLRSICCAVVLVCYHKGSKQANTNRGGSYHKKLEKAISGGATVILLDGDKVLFFRMCESSPYGASVLNDIKSYLAARSRGTKKKKPAGSTLRINKMVLWKALNYPQDVAITRQLKTLWSFGATVSIGVTE